MGEHGLDGRAAAQEDGLAVGDQGGSAVADAVFFVGSLAQALVERGFGVGKNADGPAMRAPQQPQAVEFIQVAANGGFTDAQPDIEFGHSSLADLVDKLYDPGVTGKP